MKVIITPSELMHRGVWVFACDIMGTDPCHVTPDEEIILTEEQARHIGLVR